MTTLQRKAPGGAGLAERFVIARQREIKMTGFTVAVQPATCAIPQIANPSSSAERWANYVLGACKSAKDPRTLGIWAREVGVSYTTLCESCRLMGVQPRQARDFARVLRLLLRLSFAPESLSSFLDIRDRRTLDSILQNAGFSQDKFTSRQVSVPAFLDHQRFITRENPGLRIILDVLTSSASAASSSLPVI